MLHTPDVLTYTFEPGGPEILIILNFINRLKSGLFKILFAPNFFLIYINNYIVMLLYE